MSGLNKDGGLTAPADGKSLAGFRRALLGWYEAHRRDLPWRGTRDPYRIWLSEIMLQQTRVAAVLGHYRVFLERFPDVATLAAAREDAVLAAWSGLGYYRRARMLHHCAREIVGRHGGAFPESADAWRELPGIGRYTAAAIASIAFGEPVAVVDGNVERVLKRIYASDLPPQQCWTRAEELISHKRPGDFNQAMMELGATVCLPAGPRCPVCPVQKWCGTRADAVRELARPAKVATAGARRTGERRNGRGAGAPARRQREIWCALDERHGRVRLVKRARDASIMAGMWELPEWTTAPHTANGNALWRTFRHSITVTDYTVHVMRDAGGRAAARRGRWMALDEIQQLPITGLTRKILKAGGII
ncbi:MAG: A/G-specific adenine glycosylase [Terriglobales bacterium]